MPLPSRARSGPLGRDATGDGGGSQHAPGTHGLAARAPGVPHPETGATFSRPHTRPRLTRLDVSDRVAARGLPLTVSWSFEDARSVTVDGVTDLPPTGQTTVTLERTRHVEVVARNEIGATTVRTPVVTVVPATQLESPPALPALPALPAPPTFRLHADVTAAMASAEDVRARLARAMDAQDRFRPVLAQQLQPIGVPTHFVRWLASAPRVSFFRSSS